MPNLHPLAGVYAAAVTPYLGTPRTAGKPDTAFDFESLAVFLHFLSSRGCHGALLFGTTGEGPSFSPREREALLRSIRVIKHQVRDFKFLVGTGTPSLTETIELTKLAYELGYDGTVVLPPYYFRKANEEGLFRWFSELIENAEYEAAKNEQAFVEGRIQELDMILATARVIEENEKSDVIQVGTTVTIHAEGSPVETFTIDGGRMVKLSLLMVTVVGAGWVCWKEISALVMLTLRMSSA